MDVKFWLCLVVIQATLFRKKKKNLHGKFTTSNYRAALG